MNYNPRYHNPAHLVKTILGNIIHPCGNYNFSQNELLVAAYHGTPIKFIDNFNRQLDFLSGNFNIINPSHLSDYYEGKLKISTKPYLLLTFDDGIKNNLLASKVLEVRNIKAFFFVIPNFIDTVSAKQKKFFQTNIRPIINASIYKQPEDFIAMSWDEIKHLLKQGHVIGSHTNSHTLNAHTFSQQESSNEIKESKLRIEGNTGSSIESYCSPNNTLMSTGKKEMQLISNSYSYHFTTIPGSNITKDKYFIRRANIETHWTMGAVKFATGMFEQKRWKNKEVAFLDMRL